MVFAPTSTEEAANKTFVGPKLVYAAPFWSPYCKQVAQWATIAHLAASIMFGDTIIDDAQRQVTLNLKQ